MSAIGGPLKNVSLGKENIEFSCTADEGGTVPLGEYAIERKFNGDKTSRKIMTPTGWSWKGITISIIKDQNHIALLSSMVNSPDDFPITLTECDDTIWTGMGSFDGVPEYAPGNAAVTFDLAGEGTLKKL